MPSVFNTGIYPFILVQEFICMSLEKMVLLLEKSFALLFDWINPIDCQRKSKNKVQRQQDTLLGYKIIKINDLEMLFSCF